MRFNDNSKWAGLHASLLSASKYHWVNYEPDKMAEVFHASEAAARGTRLHILAHDLIREKVELPKTTKTLDSYVNDCIGFGLTPEQTLVATPNAFGTADAIGFDLEKRLLQIFDLKTGKIDGSPIQLLVYAAFFCIEYDVKPFDIEYDLRIYQNDAINRIKVDPADIVRIISQIEFNSNLIDNLRREAL